MSKYKYLTQAQLNKLKKIEADYTGSDLLPAVVNAFLDTLAQLGAKLDGEGGLGGGYATLFDSIVAELPKE